MRSAIFAAPLMAALAHAATTDTSTDLGYTLVPEISGSVTVTSTFYYSNPATKYLTETNAAGVVTGMPSNAAGTGTALVTTQPTVVTTQPAVATIPAGLSGTYTFTYNGTAGVTSYTVIAQSSTTSILGGAGGVSTAAGSSGASGSSGATGGNGGNGPQTTGRNGQTGGSGNGNGQGASASSSGATTSSTGAASPNMQLASGGLVGLAAFVAALL